MILNDRQRHVVNVNEIGKEDGEENKYDKRRRAKGGMGEMIEGMMNAPVRSWVTWIVIVLGLVMTVVWIHRLRVENAGLEREIIGLEELYNRHTGILNEDKFNLEDGFIPIVVYVHQRPQYYQQVVDALREVTGIEKTMLIVSHDGLNKEMLSITRSIDFCQTKLLLHPVSPLHEAHEWALKEHWYWLQKTLWDEMFPKRVEDIVFIEEDHVVSPDFYCALKPLLKLKNIGVVKDTTSVAMGSYNTKFDVSEAEYTSYGGFHNTGYAFNRSIWDAIIEHNDLFDVTDPDWDTALVKGLMMNGKLGSMQLAPRLARIRNIGEMGIHENQIYFRLQRDGKHPVSENKQCGTAFFEDIKLVVRDADPPHTICKWKDCLKKK